MLLSKCYSSFCLSEVILVFPLPSCDSLKQNTMYFLRMLNLITLAISGQQTHGFLLLWLEILQTVTPDVVILQYTDGIPSVEQLATADPSNSQRTHHKDRAPPTDSSHDGRPRETEVIASTLPPSYLTLTPVI